MPVAWPIAPFPQLPTSVGSSETLPDTALRTPMDAGPAKVRRRFTSGPRGIPVRFVTTDTNVASFDTFYVTDTFGGTSEITWVNPRTGSAATLRFVGVPQYTPLGGTAWEITCAFEILP